MDDAIPCDNLDDEPAQMIEELHSGNRQYRQGSQLIGIILVA